VDWKKDCAALIPCFNEAPGVGEVVRTVREHLPTVLVVDDGSTDATAAAARVAHAEVVRHAVNRGKGIGDAAARCLHTAQADPVVL
jgi:glycosyltransferase involved in cell wall biosynthesis